MDPWEALEKSPLRIRTLDVGGYPDCFFLCVFYYLKSHGPNNYPQTVLELRAILADELAVKYPNGPQNFDHIFEEIQRVQPNLQLTNWTAYLAALRKTLYGGDLEMQALISWLARLGLRLQIILFTPGQDGAVFVQHHGNTMDSHHVWHFAYVAAHYRVVVGIDPEIAQKNKTPAQHRSLRSAMGAPPTDCSRDSLLYRLIYENDPCHRKPQLKPPALLSPSDGKKSKTGEPEPVSLAVKCYQVHSLYVL